MGLDTTHGCWHGSYTSFAEFRHAVRSVSGLRLRRSDFTESHADGYWEGEWGECDGDLFWRPTYRDPLLVLLTHSDADGEIHGLDELPLADRLDEIMPLLPFEWRDAALRFARGLRIANALGDCVQFA